MSDEIMQNPNMVFSQHGQTTFVLSRARFLYGPDGIFNEGRNKLLNGYDGDIILRTDTLAYKDADDASAILKTLGLMPAKGYHE